jgi:hypothetical protein
MPDPITSLLYSTSPEADEPLPAARNLTLTGISPVHYAGYEEVWNMVRGVEKGEVSPAAVVTATDFVIERLKDPDRNIDAVAIITPDAATIGVSSDSTREERLDAVPGVPAPVDEDAMQAKRMLDDMVPINDQY